MEPVVVDHEGHSLVKSAYISGEETISTSNRLRAHNITIVSNSHSRS